MRKKKFPTEEINHVGAGGLWAEHVDNRGFEAGGQATLSEFAPWFILGDELLLVLSKDRSSCFERTKVALPMEVFYSSKAKVFNPNSRLQLTTTQAGVIWFDQVSLMPVDTYKGYGFRNDLFKMPADIKLAFLIFPGGCFIEGNRLPNVVRWKDTIGPWEEGLDTMAMFGITGQMMD
ncbi:hypothetical protein AgCh_026536 [Apium graveolens]